MCCLITIDIDGKWLVVRQGARGEVIMLEKLLLAGFITLSLHLHFGVNWLSSKPATSTGLASHINMGKIILSQKIIK